MKVVVISLLALILFSCRNEKARQVKLNGINGEAYYSYFSESNEPIRVVKEEYLKPPFYIIIINKDTLEKGDTFKAFFSFYQGEYQILIDQPKREVITGRYVDPKEGEPYKPHEFSYTANETGVFSLTGHLKLDTLVVPFEYKFIVIP